MDGDARRFGRDDSVDEQWRIVQRVLDEPPADSALRPRHLGPARGRGRRRRFGGWHEPL